MKSILRAVLILAISSTALQSQAEVTAQAEVTVRGASSCGKWVEDRQNKTDLYGRAWLLGFLSGLSSGAGADVLKGTDNKSLYLWLENYCRKNPLSDISDGGHDLFSELAKRKKIKLN